MKLFITYYLLSGLLTMVFTKKYYKEILMSYPNLEIFHEGFLLFVQFIIGFLIFPYWFSTYLWILIKSGFFRLNLGKRFPPTVGTFAPMMNDEKWKEARKKRIEQIKEKYFPYIRVYDMEMTKEIRHLLFNSLTQENLESVLIGIVESKDTIIDGWKNCKALYLLTKEKATDCYYIIVTSEKLDLLEGWKITAIIKNPFDEGR